MPARMIEIELVNRYCAFVRGYGSRDALTAVVGRPPVWSTKSRAWVCSERTARERLLPHLEHLGIHVVITGPRAAGVQAVPAMVQTSPGEEPDPAAGLW